MEKKWKKTTPKETDDRTLHLVIGLIVPLPEALGRLPLALPWEIATADVSLGGNLGTWGSGNGGWIKNARCRKHGDLVKGEAWRWYMYWGSTGPSSLSYDPGLAQQPGIPFSTLVRGLAPIR